ncbi:MAG TPA: RDD family protein [Propionibacteriaceae bacterium]
MAESVLSRSEDGESYPGQRLGLPLAGRGSLAPWQTRITALIADWAASMAVAVGFFGPGVVSGDGWRSWMILAVFFVESAVLSALTGGSFGQLVTRIAIYRLDAQPLGFVRAFVRAGLVCLVIPAVVIGADRRGLHDTVVNTVVIRRR